MFLQGSRASLGFAQATVARRSNSSDTCLVKIFYRVGVFVEKERDLPGLPRGARARSSPDGRGVRLEDPSGLIAVVGVWTGDSPSHRVFFPSEWDPPIPLR